MSDKKEEEKTDNNNTTTPSSANPNNNNNNNDVENKVSDSASQHDETASVTNPSPPSSVASASSSRIPKQSGIKPPSRVGRPCGGIHKPAIPATPTKNSSDDSIRRIIDDFGRHRLTDLLEADESEDDALDYYLRASARRKRFSSFGSTASSMDGLWELHPRRLSEAGLSRHSDSSAVLTEDTDSFMIGQRVWVGGTKPGTIAYIGETQFAPGEWAGIALDEAIGKNDGSVAGIHYFQCENKKGVFSRLTRLTRVPLEQPGMGSNDTFSYSSPTNNGTRRSPISPTGSTRSLLRSPAALSNSNTSLASTSTQHVDFKIGDRVIIKSTQGSKIGMVRYMGLTDFAPGEWVGVELDDPRGKNDGSVAGKRYFDCRPNFGLFAPISKISKSPSKYKPGSCVIHSGPGLPPSGMKRANSRESMTSLASRTSVNTAPNVRRVRLGVTSLTPKNVSSRNTTPLSTRTALQDVLREKQQHIEQLLKERDLERQEITRAASQADDVEQKLFALQREYEQYRTECEQKLHENMDLLSQLKTDRSELLAQIEDEKRKNEDLLFKFEEAAITKGDIEVTNACNITKIKELESLLEAERLKAENLEATSNKLFEAEENLIKAREEVENLRKTLAEVSSQGSAAAQEQSKSIEFIASLQKQLDQLGEESKHKTDTIETMNAEIAKFKIELEAAHKNLENTTVESEGKQNECEAKSKEIEILKSELDNTRQELTSKIDAYSRVEIEKSDAIKENDQLKMELSAKVNDLESASEKITLKENDIKLLQAELEASKAEINRKSVDLERYQKSSSEAESDMKKELDEARENLKSITVEIENVKQQYEVQLIEKNKLIEEASSANVQRETEIVKLNGELVEIKKNLQESNVEIQQKHAKQIEDKDAQLAAVASEVKQKRDEATNLQITINKLQETITDRDSNVEKLRTELNSVQQQHGISLEESSKLSEQLAQLQLTNGDLQRQLSAAEQRIAEALEQKQHAEQQIQLISNAKGDAATQIEQLRADLKEKETSLESIRMELNEKLQISERSRQETELRDAAALEQLTKARKELEDKLSSATQTLTNLQQRCDNSTVEASKLREDLAIKSNELETVLAEKDTASDQFTTAKKELEEKLETTSQALNNLQQSCDSSGVEVSKLREELAIKNSNLETALREKDTAVKQLADVRRELEEKLSSATLTLVNLQERCDGSIVEVTKLQEELAMKNNLLESALVEKSSNMTKLEEQLIEMNKKHHENLTQVTEELSKKCQSSEEREKVLLEELAKLKEELVKKAEEVTEATSTSSLISTQNQQRELEIQQICDQKVKKIEEDLSDKNNLLDQIAAERDALKVTCHTSNTDLEIKNQEIQQLLGQVKTTRATIDELQTQLQAIQQEGAKTQQDSQVQSKNLLDQINELSEKAIKSNEQIQILNAQQNHVINLLNQIKLTNKQKHLFTEKIQADGDTADNQFLLDVVKKIETPVVDETAEQILSLQNELDATKASFSQRSRQFESQRIEIERLQEQLKKVQVTKVTDAPQGPIDANAEKLIQDKELAENQIKFLNSIIVDIQKKNEEQKARIEILEMGCTAEMVEDLDLLGASSLGRKLPPRVYCDICEEFDLHETEDCPTQNNDMPPPAFVPKMKKDIPERAYCDICEMFGHATEDCQEDETF